MNITEVTLSSIIDALNEAKERTRIELSIDWLTMTKSMTVWAYAAPVESATVSTFEELQEFLNSLPSKPDHIAALIEKRDALQRQIDELGGETLICNGE